MKHSNCYWNVKNIDHSITNMNTGAIWLNWISFTNSPFVFIYRNFQTPLPSPILFRPPLPLLLHIWFYLTASPFIRDPISLYWDFKDEKPRVFMLKHYWQSSQCFKLWFYFYYFWIVIKQQISKTTGKYLQSIFVVV